jgi:hypothetical protein
MVSFLIPAVTSQDKSYDLEEGGTALENETGGMKNNPGL